MTSFRGSELRFFSHLTFLPRNLDWIYEFEWREREDGDFGISDAIDEYFVKRLIKHFKVDIKYSMTFLRVTRVSCWSIVNCFLFSNSFILSSSSRVSDECTVECRSASVDENKLVNKSNNWQNTQHLLSPTAELSARKKMRYSEHFYSVLGLNSNPIVIHYFFLWRFSNDDCVLAEWSSIEWKRLISDRHMNWKCQTRGEFIQFDEKFIQKKSEPYGKSRVVNVSRRSRLQL